MAVGQLILGSLADRYGRRRILLSGAAITICASIIAATTNSSIQLIIGMALLGIAAAAGMISSRAVISDLSEGIQAIRAFSIYGLIVGIAPMLGPLGGALLIWAGGWRTIFYAFAIIGVVLFVCVYLWVSESLPPDKRQIGGLTTVLTNARLVLVDPVFTLHTLILCSSIGAMFAYISASSFVAQNVLNLSVTENSVMFGVNALGTFVSGAISAQLARTVKGRKLIRSAVTIQVIGAVTLLLSIQNATTNAPLLLAGMFLIASSLGMLFGPASALAVVNQRDRAGVAFAVLGASQFFFAAISTPLVGLSGDHSATSMVIVIIAFTLITVIAFQASRKSSRTIEKELT